jgi:hypothetical protein
MCLRTSTRFPIAASNKQEEIMLKNFAAVLLATTLIAGPALAAQSQTNVGSAPVAQTAPVAAAKQATNVTPAKTVKYASRHSRKHVVRAKSGTMHLARHTKPAKSHQAKISHRAHFAKSVKPIDGGRPRA